MKEIIKKIILSYVIALVITMIMAIILIIAKQHEIISGLILVSIVIAVPIYFAWDI